MTPVLCGIYKIESQLYPDRLYIGSSINIIRRQKEHNKTLSKNYHPNAKLQSHYNKYGARDLLFSIIELCDKDILIEREQSYMDALKPSFNLRPIAENNTGYVASEITRERLRVSHLGQKPSEESLQKNRVANSGVNNAMFGKKHKPESIQKMKDVKIGVYVKEKNPFFGKHHKQEAIDKIIEKKKGKHSSPATEFKKGMIQSPEIIRKKADKLKKPVIQLSLNGDFIKRWDGISDITKTGFKHTSISNCCNNKRTSYCGFIWIFEKDYKPDRGDE